MRLSGHVASLGRAHSDELESPLAVMAALVAAIHVFLAERLARKAWMAGMGPAMTRNNWFDISETRSHAQR